MAFKRFTANQNKSAAQGMAEGRVFRPISPLYDTPEGLLAPPWTCPRTCSGGGLGATFISKHRGMEGKPTGTFLPSLDALRNNAEMLH